MDRRNFLSAAAGLGALAFTPEAVFAAAANSGEWTLAVRDVEADVAPRALRLVQGRAPAGLDGVLYRNGPARFHRPGGSASHWFDGDGMVRRFAISDGQASLAARFVDTPKRRADEAAGAVVTPGFGTPGSAKARLKGPDDANAANTSVMMAAGELWALWEGGSPVSLNPETLETRGLHTFRPDLKGMPFLAHPRVEPDGRVWNLGVSGRRAVVWRLSPAGELEAVTPIELPRGSYLHDFTATERHLVLVLQPWIFERMAAPISAGFAWRPEQGTQVLVLEKADLSRRRIYETDAFAFFHLSDAWEDTNGTIRFEVCAEPTPDTAVQGARALVEGRAPDPGKPELRRITLHPDGRAELTSLGLAAEFPRSDPRFAGGRRRYGVVLSAGEGGSPLFNRLAVRDEASGRILVHDFGSDHIVDEMVFVPRPGGSAEFDGWLVGTSVNLRARATELHVFDARRPDRGPLCTWRADLALPATFHGVFVRA